MAQKEAIQKLDDVLKQWTSTPMGRRTFLASLPLLMAACATEQHRQREGNLRGDETSLTVADEKRMTSEVLPQMRKDYPAIQNPQLQSYISQLGRKIVSANSLEGHPYNYNFTAVDVGYVNAFALPAGTVFITAPLIAMADSEAELAGVIGHEVGHIKARHTAIRMDAAKKAEGKSWMYAAGGGLLGGALGYGLGKMLCKQGDDECMQKATLYGAAAGAGGGLLIQKYAFMANSREDEMEADRIGFRTSVAAGYDKDKVGLFYDKLLKMEEQNKGQQNALMTSLADAMSTHPPSRERVTQMNQMAAEQARNPRAITSTKEFDRMKALCTELAKKKQQKS
ncbi:M48 family metalloprotease [Bdellovibrio bacteriovorus]|uniref:M48 family metalloprotease n=1 Tax=Bdellovibrio bacteriovorus TaxID=959 RepID=UPI0021D130C7|nr:M48 family metalloprotease [Bdellovibrio bacteriovorus]UXR65534.1 M48 family metalloprotease [Bdellovibrio bacteriovorus]